MKLSDYIKNVGHKANKICKALSNGVIDNMREPMEGYFSIDCIDKNGNVIDHFEDHNMIMLSARQSMAEIFANMNDIKRAHKLVLGTLGNKEGKTFVAKEESDGFVKERDRLFSEKYPIDVADGSLFQNINKGDVIRTSGYDNEGNEVWEYYQYTGERAENIVFDKKGDYWVKLEFPPYTYEINFKLPGKNSNILDNCNACTDPNDKHTNDVVRVEQKDTSVVFYFYVDTNNANDQESNVEYDMPTTQFTEAALYVNDRIFSMKTFGTKIKDATVKLRIIWTITF